LFSVKLQWLSAGGFAGLGGGHSSRHPLAAAAGDSPRGGAGRDPGAGHPLAVLEVLPEDFVRTARAKGRSRRQVMWGTCCATP